MSTIKIATITNGMKFVLNAKQELEAFEVEPQKWEIKVYDHGVTYTVRHTGDAASMRRQGQQILWELDACGF